MTENLDLKKWLAEELQDTISLNCFTPFGGDGTNEVCTIKWKRRHGVSGDNIKETEWLCIVGLAEGKLSGQYASIYAVQLRRLLGFHKHSYFDLIHATWQQRAQCIRLTLTQSKDLEIKL